MNTLTVVAIALGGVGCDDDGGSGDGQACGDPADTDATPVDYVADVEPILLSNCTCHLAPIDGSDMEAPFLTLNPDTGLAQLVDVPSEESPLVRVAPGCRDDSYLWHKLSGTHLDVEGSGTVMPPTGALDPADVEIVGRWISAGAPG